MGSAGSKSTFQPRPWQLRVLWESPHERVVYKPAGVASELTSDPHRRSIIAQVRKHCPEARLPHRLDRICSGILLVALNSKSVRHHNRCVESRDWKKLYVARIQTPSDVGELLGEQKAFLKRRRHRRGLDRMEVVRSGGQPSFLEIHRMEDAPDFPGQSHVLVELKTGRYHQIRAMLAGLGSPLVGDTLYGGTGRDVFLEHIRLRFRPFEADEDQVVFDQSAPEREAIAPALLAQIADWEGGSSGD